MKNYIKNFISFKDDERGSVLIMVAAFILVVIAISGAAVDFGRAQLVQIKKQQASDMATLAAAYIIPEFTDGNKDDEAIREDTATRYYNLNFPASYLGVTRKAITTDASTRNITVATSDDTVPTNYINTSGISGVRVGADTKVNIPEKDFPDFDVVVVVDESSSAAYTPLGFSKSIIATEKDAINSMLTVLFPDAPLPDGSSPNPNLRFSLIGYTGAITQASPLTSKVNDAKNYVKTISAYVQNYDHWGLEAAYNTISGDWKGFVPPKHCYKPAGHWKDGCTPNFVDGPSKNSPKRDLNNCWVNDNPDGIACIPERNTAVNAPATARTKVNKATGEVDLLSPSRHVVLISDGYIMEEPVPCSAGKYYSKTWPLIDTEIALPDDTCKNYRAVTDMCKKIKDIATADINVNLYVISFVSEDPDDVKYLQECVSPPVNDHYFTAKTAAELQTILGGIAKKIHSIRITD